MTGRSAGFHPREAVVSILSALRERNGVSVAEPPRPQSARIACETASASLVTGLASGHSLFKLADPQNGLEVETRTWVHEQERVPAYLRTGGAARIVFSIRESEGNCVALIVAEGASPTVVAILLPRYRPQAVPSAGSVARAMLSMGVHLGRHAQRLGGVIDSEQRLHFIDDAPDRLELSDDFCGHISDPVIMPKVLSSKGDFTVMDSTISRNSVSASVKGTLGLVNVRSLVLPSLLNVGKDLLIQLSDAKALPSRFSVGRDLNIALTQIVEFPEQFHVGRHVVANGSSISRLRGGISFKGDLNLRDCPITELPWGLEVNGSLDLTGTKITRIPGDALIKGNLMVEEAVIVPSTVRLGGRLMYGRPYGYETVSRSAN